MNERTSLLSCVPGAVAQALAAVPDAVWKDVEEVRLRKNAAVVLSCASCMIPLRVTVSAEELHESFWKLCSRAVHTHQAELACGFITTDEGFRVGVAGTAVIKDGSVTSYRDITSLCVRIARRVAGCAAPLLPYVYKDGTVRGMLLCGAPSTGKTTLLRDLAIQLGTRCRVAVVDERMELFCGDMGMCDVIRGCPKAQAILQAVRTLSPDVVIVDELGDEREWQEVAQSVFCGVAVVASAHISGARDLRLRPFATRLLASNGFQYVVSLPPRADTHGGATVQKAVDYLENNGDCGDRVFLRGVGTVGGMGTAPSGTSVASVGDPVASSSWHPVVYGATDPNHFGIDAARRSASAHLVGVV